MKYPVWLLRLLPYFTFICPKCKKEVKSNSHQCPRCNEKYPLALKVPFKGFKNTEALGLYVHEKIFPRITEAQRQYLKQYFTVYAGPDDFEDNTYDAWSGTVVTTNETIAVSTEQARSGTHSSKSTSNGSSATENSYFYYTVNLAEFYARVYVYISSHNATANGDLISFIRGRQSTNLLAHFGMRVTSGTLRWWMQCRSGTSYIDNYTASGVAPSTGQWYCVEGYWLKHATAGGTTMWVDGTQILSTMTRDTDNYGNCDRIGFGIAETGGTVTAVVYADDAVVSDTYNGLAVSTYTTAFTTGANFLKNISKDFTLNTALLKNLQKEVTAAASLQKTLTAPFTANSSLQGTLLKQVTANTNLLASFTKEITSNADLLKSQNKQFTSNANLLITTTKLFSIASNLQITFSKPLTSGADLQGTLLKTFTIGSELQEPVVTTAAFTVNASLLKKQTKALTVSAELQLSGEKELTVNANLLAVQTKPFTFNAALLQNFLDSFTINASLTKTLFDQFTINAELLKNTALPFTVNTSLLKQLSTPFTVGAELIKVQTKTFTVSSELFAPTLEFTFNAELSATRTKGFSVGAELRLRQTILKISMLKVGSLVVAEEKPQIKTDAQRGLSLQNSLSKTGSLKIELESKKINIESEET